MYVRFFIEVGQSFSDVNDSVHTIDPLLPASTLVVFGETGRYAM